MKVKLRASSSGVSFSRERFNGQKLRIGPRHNITVAPGIMAISRLKIRSITKATIVRPNHNGKVMARIAGMVDVSGLTTPPYAAMSVTSISSPLITYPEIVSIFSIVSLFTVDDYGIKNVSALIHIHVL